MIIWSDRYFRIYFEALKWLDVSFTIIVLYNPINRLNKNITTGRSWKIVCNWAYDYPKSKCIIYFRSTEISRFFELMVTLFNVVMYNIASTKNNLLPLLRIYICLMLSWWPTDIARNVSFAIIVEFIYIVGLYKLLNLIFYTILRMHQM